MSSLDVRERLERLERANRQMRWGTCVLLALIAAAFGLGAIKGDRSLDAEELIIRDKTGNERIRLAVDESGPYLRLLDTRGRPRALLLVQDAGSFLALQGGAEKSRVTLSNLAEPALFLQDNNGKARAELSTKGETVRLILTDPNQNESMIMASAKDGPSISCFDDQKKLRAQLSVSKSEGATKSISQFSLLDGLQKQRASMHADNGSAAFALADENEIRRIALFQGTGKGGAIIQYGKYGEPILDTSAIPEIFRKQSAGPGPRVGEAPPTHAPAPSPAPTGSSNPEAK
jgi:hypothetical protein